MAPGAKRRESVAALLASLRLEPSSFRTACCSPVLVEVEVHQGVVKQGSLLQQVDENMAAHASSAAAAAAPVMEELQLLRPRRLVLRRRWLLRRRRLQRLRRSGGGQRGSSRQLPALHAGASRAAQVDVSWICSHLLLAACIWGVISHFISV